MAWPTMTAALLLTEVRTLLGEPTARRVSDVEIYSSMDRAFSLMAKDSMAYQGTADITLATDDYTYTTPADCVGIRAAIFMNSGVTLAPGTDAKALQKMHPRHFSNIAAYPSAKPLEYAYFAGVFYVWPAPVVAYNAQVVKLLYYKNIEAATGIEAISDATLIGYLPRHYQYYAVWYAYAQALMKLGKPEQALQYMSYFDNFIAYHHERDYTQPGVDSADMMNFPDRVEFVG